jgi:hypothetical protein
MFCVRDLLGLKYEYKNIPVCTRNFFWGWNRRHTDAHMHGNISVHFRRNKRVLKHGTCIRLKVYAAVNTSMLVFRVVTLCGIVGRYRHRPEDRGHVFPRNGIPYK